MAYREFQQYGRNILGKRVNRRGFLATSLMLGAASSAYSPITVLGRARQQQNAVTFLEGTDITTMDPSQVTDTPTGSVINLLYENLVQFSPENEIIPGAAESWTTSDDNLTWTFTLREDLFFSNGDPLTADDVVYTIKRTQDPEIASTGRAQLEPVIDVVAVDDRTVDFITDVPFAELLIPLAGNPTALLSRKASEGIDPQTYGREPVGSGPWMLESWTTGDRAEFIPNPHYTGPYQAKVERIIYRPVPEAGTRTAMLQTGEADVAVKVSPVDMPTLEGAEGVVVVAQPSMYQISIELNVTVEDPPLNSLAFRHALNHAVDKEAIVSAVLGGYGDVAVSPFGPGIQFRTEFEPYAYDPDKAKQLLEESGASDATISLWSPNGRYLNDRQVSEAVQGYLQDVGLNAELEVWEWTPYVSAIREDPSRQAFMVGRATPGADYNATRLFSTEAIGQYNSSGFSNPEVDELLAQGRTSFDDEERTAIYGDIQRIVWEEAPWLFLHNQQTLWAHSESVSGVIVHPHETVDLRGVTKSS